MAQDGIRRLEDGPLGGTPIYLGQEHYGDLVDCLLPDDGPWPVAGISDPTLAQTAWQLERGALLLPTESRTSTHSIPIVQIGDFASPGFSDMEIIGDQPNGVPQGSKQSGPWLADSDNLHRKQSALDSGT